MIKLDHLTPQDLLNCCHSQKWVDKLFQHDSFSSRDAFLQYAEEAWFSLSEADWLKAFQAHPKIGGTAKGIAANEQKAVSAADQKTLEELAVFNDKYEKKFGFIYIVFATGKTAQEMLKILKTRIENSRAQELKNAAKEQCKIMRLRLEKIL